MKTGETDIEAIEVEIGQKYAHDTKIKKILNFNCILVGDHRKKNPALKKGSNQKHHIHFRGKGNAFHFFTVTVLSNKRTRCVEMLTYAEKMCNIRQR